MITIPPRIKNSSEGICKAHILFCPDPDPIYVPYALLSPVHIQYEDLLIRSRIMSVKFG
jgi:hypothetical protein